MQTIRPDYSIPQMIWSPEVLVHLQETSVTIENQNHIIAVTDDPNLSEVSSSLPHPEAYKPLSILRQLGPSFKKPMKYLLIHFSAFPY